MSALVGALWRTIPLFCIARVPVRIHTTCLLYPTGFLAWVVWKDHLLFWPTDALPMQALAVLLLLKVLWGSLLVHEFAHVLVARRFGVQTRSIVFIPFGAAALFERPLRDTRELWIAAVGPAASLAVAGFFWMALPGHPFSIDFSALPPPVILAVRFGVVINLMIALFNLLPCFPMDGGRMLRSLLAIAIEGFSRRKKSGAFELASCVVVRFVNPVVATAVMVFTILSSHAWLHLLLFPLLLAAAELEHRELCRSEKDAETDW